MFRKPVFLFYFMILFISDFHNSWIYEMWYTSMMYIMGCFISVDTMQNLLC